MIERKIPGWLLLQVYEKKQKEDEWNLESLRNLIQETRNVRREAAFVQPEFFQRQQPAKNQKSNFKK